MLLLRTKTAILLALGLLGIAGPLTAQAVLIYPGDPRWEAGTRGSAGTVEITGANPRSGNGSLELQTTGALEDWAFFLHAAGARETASWGLLSALDRLAFDWYRETPVAGDAPWQAQTPVLRLHLRQGSFDAFTFSELVWEQYYTTEGPAETGAWVDQNLLAQNFWRYVEPGKYTIAGGTDQQEPFFPNPLLTHTPSGWSTFLAPEAYIWGISLGVGSNWPLAYLGFVDNVRLGFAGRDLTVDANFELIPEPSTLLLLATGLLAFLGRPALRRRAPSPRA